VKRKVSLRCAVVVVVLFGIIVGQRREAEGELGRIEPMLDV